MTKLFEGVVPTKFIWVSPSGSNSNSGSQDSPLLTIQAAADLAKTSAYGAGTAIMVREGTYHETVDLKGAGGTSTNPVWVISADGLGKAKVVADATDNAFTASSTSNMVIRGFEIDGGDDLEDVGDGNGIQFTGGVSLVQNILIEDNYIYGCSFDGIKIADANNIQIINNKIDDSVVTTPHTKEEGIDFVTVTNSLISNNTVIGGSLGNSGITAKSGSENVLIENNYVDGMASGAGIKVGGEGNYSGPYMAKNVIARGNHIGTTSDSSIVFSGAIDSAAEDNYVRTIKLKDNNNGIQTDNITLTDNVVRQTNWFFNQADDDGTAPAYNVTGTVVNGTWTGNAGQQAGFYDPIFGTIASPFQDSSAWAISGAYTNTVTGTTGIDTLYGTSGNDRMNGDSGADTLIGGLGDDLYFAGGMYENIVENANEGIDTAWCFSTGYTLAANVENLEVRLSNPNSSFAATGNGLDNIIKGNVTKDTIKGMGGEDLLTGGGGEDVFVYTALSDKGDIITDFEVGVDTLDLTALLAGLSGSTQVYSTVQSDGVTLFVDNGGQHHALVHLQGLTAPLALGTDFFV
jgi:parallel beta-helix repeat protein